jgi:alkylation response protein AidB-like acyl-CoA dehydrogenase
MDFGLSSEQRQFDESLRDFLRDSLPMARLSSHAQAGAQYDAALWDGLVRLGVSGLMVPERFGGSGLGVLDAAVAAEALGHAFAPAPFVGPTVMAPLALMSAASEAEQEEFLPLIAKGVARIAVVFTDPGTRRRASCTVRSGDKLCGALDGVVDGAAATHFLVFLPDDSVALVSAEASGLTKRRSSAFDRLRSLVDVTLDSTPARIMSAGLGKADIVQRVLGAGRVVLAADSVGAAQNMLDRAVAYAKERVQFGRLIGSFQGVKYVLADCVTALEPCRALVWYAAYAQDQSLSDSWSTACHAKAHISDVVREVARLTTETHGGIGFTDLLGLHYWFKRIAFNRQVLGRADECREDAARAQGWASG